jgi:hypothetical protein
MAKGQGKTGLIVTIIVLGLTLIVVSAIVLLNRSNGPAVTNQTDTSDQSDADDLPAQEETPTETPTDETTEPTVDPATLSSIDIEPLEITVYYTKGLPGFEFAVKRTSSGTEYIEFSASQLVGTKCTDDIGLFAIIVKNPGSEEDNSTITHTVTVGGNTYGLSLTGANCTSDTDLLKQYQSAFVNGLSSLKEME